MTLSPLAVTDSTSSSRQVVSASEDTNPRIFADAVPIAMLLVDAHTQHFHYANREACRLYRYRADEWTRLHWSDLQRPPGLGQRKEIDLPSFLREKGVATHFRKDGVPVDVELRWEPATHFERPVFWVSVHDVTSQVEAESALRGNERRYRWLVEHTSDCVWRFELEMGVPVGLSTAEQIDRFYQHAILAEVNQTMAATYGYSQPADMLGMRLQALMPRENIQNVIFLESFIAHGYQLFDVESLEVDIHGQPRWMRNRLMGEVTAGCLVRAWGASRDITACKLAELRHRRNEQLWHDALVNVHLLGVGVDQTGRVTFVNPFFSQLTGFTRDEILGRDLSGCLGANDADASNMPPPDRADWNKPEIKLLRTKNGAMRAIRWHHTAIRDEQGECRGIFSLGEDVTDQQATLSALKESEERYRRLVEELPVGVYRSTPDGQLSFCNPASARLIGLPSPAEACNIDLEAYPFGATYSRKLFRERMEREGEIRGHEMHWIFPDGRERWVRESARAVRDDRGQVQCYEGTLEDITTEKQSQAAKLESEEQHRLLMQLAPIGIFMSRNGEICRANDILVHMLGYDSPEELLGRSLLELLHPAEREDIKRHYLEGPAEYGILPMQERRFWRKDGKTIIMQAHIARVRVNDQRGSIVAVRDITAERQADQERRRWQNRMVEMQKLESLGLLAGGLAHDFNNQLTVIRGHVHLTQQLLKEQPAALELLSPVELAARHATDLCQQMLSFAGRGHIAVSRVNLRDLVQDAAALLRVACHRKALLQLDLSAQTPEIQAEPGQLRQVVLNLVQNAAEAMSDAPGVIIIKTYTARIDTSCSHSEVTLELQHGEYVVLEVSDNGAGMDINTRRRIFEPFFTTKPTGRGLGLPAVLGIVRSHGGAIEVTSKLKQGTTFRVFLPLENRLAAMKVQPPPVREAATPRQETILVVDDEGSLRSLTAKVLANHGWSVLEAEDGHSAVQLMREKGSAIRLAMIDLAMPGMDGVDTLRALWKIRPELPAIAMSSLGTKELERRFAGLPLAGLLAKPFTPTGLLQVMESALGAAVKI